LWNLQLAEFAILHQIQFMPSRASKRTVLDELEDTNSLAARIVAQTTGSPPPQPAKNPFAVALGRLGASKGGKARAANLSANQRKEIAQKAARTRWKKQL
jgi:hypothetical protein